MIPGLAVPNKSKLAPESSKTRLRLSRDKRIIKKTETTVVVSRFMIFN